MLMFFMKKITYLKKQLKIAEQEGFIKMSYASYITKYKRPQIQKLIDEGYVSIKRVSMYVLVNKEELLAVRFKRGDIPFDNRHYQALVRKVDKLIRKVNVLEKVLDLYYEPLVLNEKELKSLYLEAERLEIESLSDVIKWSEILLRMDETHFKLLDECMGKKDTWKAFIELAYYNYYLAKRRDMSEAKKLAYKAYKQIKQSVILYIREPKLIEDRVKLFRHTRVLIKAKRTRGFYKFLRKPIASMAKENLDIDDKQT